MPLPDHPSPRILVVDDERAMAEMVADGLADRGYEATACASSEEAVARLRAEAWDALVTDLRMPDVDGLTLLAEARRASPDLPVIVMTAYGAIDTAIESIRQGASHYLTKPFKLEELALFLDRLIDERGVRREAKALRAVIHERPAEAGIIAASKAMHHVFEVIDRMARSDVPVLLLGETGTGKGLFARILHARSARAEGPFVTVNCAALPEPLLESELFGHVKGAFTGAVRESRGLFVESSGGTLFLDEIAEMSPPLQAKLLDVLERGVVRAVGSNKERALDVRVVAATHRDLRRQVAEGHFREDLLFRLNVVSLEIPPLRHRRDDLPQLLEHFLGRARQKHPRSAVARFLPDAMTRLADYTWPGNVRELENVVERIVLLAQGPEISVADLPPAIEAAKPRELEFSGPVLPLADVSRRYAAWAFERLEGRRMLTAEKLGVDRKTLVKLLA
jgi:two-component system response regulator HydG